MDAATYTSTPVRSYFGSCSNVKEALILIEAAKQGIIPIVTGRLSDSEKQTIASGSIYVWDESRCSMQRWTDGRAWTNSKVVGDFLEYRETMYDSHYHKARKSIEIENGLRKRSISVRTRDGEAYHLIAYFRYMDMRNGALKSPSTDWRFQDIVKMLNNNTSPYEGFQTVASKQRSKRRRLRKKFQHSFDNSASNTNFTTIEPHTSTPKLANHRGPTLPEINSRMSLQKLTIPVDALGRPTSTTWEPHEVSIFSPSENMSIKEAARAFSKWPTPPPLVGCRRVLHSEDRRVLDLLNCEFSKN